MPVKQANYYIVVIPIHVFGGFFLTHMSDFIVVALVSLIIYAGVNSVPGYCALAIQILNSVWTGNHTQEIAS